jgi:hypothetical protein
VQEEVTVTVIAMMVMLAGGEVPVIFYRVEGGVLEYRMSSSERLTSSERLDTTHRVRRIEGELATVR